MSAITKLGAFVAGLALVLTAAFGVGRVVGPVGDPEPKAEQHGHGKGPAAASSGGHDRHGDASADGTNTAAQSASPGGLQVSERGYTLVLDRRSLRSGRTPLTFRILGPSGKPLTSYQRTHDRDLHLILVKRDLSGFQHVHPSRDKKGRWTVDVSLTPGTWRVFADFKPQRSTEGLTLGSDLTVPGTMQLTPLPAPSATATIDGYTVSLKGKLTPGEGAKLTLTVAKGGRPVSDLQPYLGAYGHLVALRESDLAYLHVHPDGEPGDGKTKAGPQVAFHAAAPSRGSYRLYLDFKHGNVVRTAEFTVSTGGSVAPEPSAPSSDHADDGHSH